jgi:alkanesulfonate monooxygenase SsuD/methylene tetrahydromethanopterin reductase-like flavin-dependent oxidoreductase (luciferase family)
VTDPAPAVRFGVHLPLMDFGDQRFAVEHLVEYVETATGLGFDAVSVNDHMVFGVPWLDGPTALAAVVSCSGDARLFTPVANPVVRGPAALAKVLAGLDVLSGGRSRPGSVRDRRAGITRRSAFHSRNGGRASTRP